MRVNQDHRIILTSILFPGSHSQTLSLQPWTTQETNWAGRNLESLQVLFLLALQALELASMLCRQVLNPQLTFPCFRSTPSTKYLSPPRSPTSFMMSLNHNSSVNSINSSLPLTSSSLYNSRLGSSPTFLNTSSSSSSSPMMSPNSSGYYSSHPSSPVSSFSSAVSSPVRHHQQHPQYHHEQQQHPQYQQPHRQLFPQNEILMQNLINLLHISNWKLSISTQ